MKTFLLIFFLISGFFCLAQETKVVKEKSMVTGKEVEWRIEGKDAVVVRDSSSHYIPIYVKDVRDILYGNRCAENEGKKMRVEFIIIPNNIGYGMSGFTRFRKNLGGNFRAFFRNGPFWKKRLKKRIRKCQDQTGDFIR